ncbi:MAG: HD domain-containing protein, partial [Dehalococcoidia bacterium]|nr:HD domain-containing protein [Dehalococcoidia bacterium]
MSLNRTARVYIVIVVLVAAAFLSYWVEAWEGGIPFNPGLLLVMVALGIAAVQFPLTLSPRFKVDTGAAVYFASLLLFGAPLGMVVVAISQLLGGLLLGLRPHPIPGKSRRTLRSVLFNTSQQTIAYGVGGLIYYSFVPQVAPASLSGLVNILAVPFSAAGIFMANSLLVSVMVGLHLKQNPIEVWVLGWRLDGVQFAGLFLIGVVAALASAHDAWVPLIMALPAGLIYLSLKRTIELMEQTVSAVETMADVVDMRDHYTFEHSKRVADYAVQIARSMRLPAEEISAIRLAARVHDLGKIGVPDSILLKQSRLTEPEWEVMKRHPEVGHNILSRFPQYQRGKELVLTHHERFDGNGYPN